jgi:hypothetical protein
MPRDGAIIFADLIGKLDLLRVACYATLASTWPSQSARSYRVALRIQFWLELADDEPRRRDDRRSACTALLNRGRLAMSATERRCRGGFGSQNERTITLVNMPPLYIQVLDDLGGIMLDVVGTQSSKHIVQRERGRLCRLVEVVHVHCAPLCVTYSVLIPL